MNKRRRQSIDPIALIRQMAAKGFDHNAIARELSARGIPPLGNAQRWYPSSVLRIMRDNNRRKAVRPAKQPAQPPAAPAEWYLVTRGADGVWRAHRVAESDRAGMTDAIARADAAARNGADIALAVRGIELAATLGRHAATCVEVTHG